MALRAKLAITSYFGKPKIIYYRAKLNLQKKLFQLKKTINKSTLIRQILQFAGFLLLLEMTFFGFKDKIKLKL